MRHVSGLKIKDAADGRNQNGEGGLTTASEDIEGMWGRNVINQAINKPFIYSPASPADMMSAMGQNRCLDEVGDTDPAEEKGKKKTKNGDSVV